MRGGSIGTDTIRSASCRSTVSRAAHSTARSDSSDPSVAAMMALAAIPSSSSLYCRNGAPASAARSASRQV
jgi:hypothetical protein